MNTKQPYIRRQPKVTGVIVCKPGNEPATGTRTPSKMPASLTHGTIRLGRWETVVKLPEQNGIVLDRTSSKVDQANDYSI